MALATARFLVGCLALWSLGCGASSAASPRRAAPAADLAAAVRAFEAYDVAESRARYRAVLAAPGTPRADRIAAHQALARYAWRFDGDAAAAVAEIDAALRIADDASPLWAQRGRIELEARRLEAAPASAERALATRSESTGPSSRRWPSPRSPSSR